MEVVDLFAGLGGFSAGALLAGATVVLGVDHDPVPLKLWAANVPSGRAKLATLGPGGDSLELPPPSPSLHLHASTPCTDFSSARGNSVSAEDVDRGVQMLKWALDLILARGDVSWSLENVSTPTTRKVLDEYTTRFAGKVAYASLDAADFGAPQTRIRLIAAPPELIKLLQEMPAARRVSVRDAFCAQGLEVVAPAFKNQTRNRDGTPCRRSVEEQAFTVCASHALTWTDRDGKTVRVMSARESACLMGFPTSWRLPTGSRHSQRAVGNAMSVEMSKAIVQAATSIKTGRPIASIVCTSSPLVKTTTDHRRDSGSEPDSRLSKIESLLRSLRRRQRKSHRQTPPHPSASVH